MADEVVTPKVEEAKVDASLKDTIKNAIIETKEEPKTEVKEESKKEEVKDEKKDELNAEQQAFAVNLYKALANPDPKVQRQALDILAKAANLELRDVETKKEVVEAKKDLTALLKDGLGEFDFLADKLGPILDKVLKDYVTENTKDIREQQNLTARERQEEQVNTAIDNVFNNYTLNETDKATLVKEMEGLMDQFQPSKKSTHEQYFKALIVLAAENKGINLKLTNTKALADKITKNRNDAGGRLASERGAEVKDVVRTQGFKNLKDAIKDAVEQSQIGKK